MGCSHQPDLGGSEIAIFQNHLHLRLASQTARVLSCWEIDGWGAPSDHLRPRSRTGYSRAVLGTHEAPTPHWYGERSPRGLVGAGRSGSSKFTWTPGS